MMPKETEEEEYQRNFSEKMTAYAERFFLPMDLEADKSADCLIKAFKDHVPTERQTVLSRIAELESEVKRLNEEK